MNVISGYFGLFRGTVVPTKYCLADSPNANPNPIPNYNHNHIPKPLPTGTGH